MTDQPVRLIDRMWRAVLTLFAAAVVVRIASGVFASVMPTLLIGVALVFIIRCASRATRGRSGW